ncbi:hypothetical protein Dimus_039314 [Dionaea muscipula]
MHQMTALNPSSHPHTDSNKLDIKLGRKSRKNTLIRQIGETKRYGSNQPRSSAPLSPIKHHHTQRTSQNPSLSSNGRKSRKGKKEINTILTRDERTMHAPNHRSTNPKAALLLLLEWLPRESKREEDERRVT